MRLKGTALPGALALVLLLRWAGAAAAQVDDDLGGADFAAYAAAVFTPTGAFVPAVTPTMSRGAPAAGSVGIRGHYGYLSGSTSPNYNSYGLGVDFTAGANALGLTLGQVRPSCPDEDDPCDTHLMFGATWERGIVDATLGTTAARFTIGVDAGIGYAKPGDESPISDGGKTSLLTMGIGMPVALTSGGAGAVRFTPYLRPGAIYGRVRQEPDPSDAFDRGFNETGANFVLGAGLGISGLAPGLAISLGAQHFMLELATTVVGVGVSFHGFGGGRTMAER